jgi:hypothetical protein
MPPSVQHSNAKHWTCDEPGWEAVADYALEWALERATDMRTAEPAHAE